MKLSELIAVLAVAALLVFTHNLKGGIFEQVEEYTETFVKDVVLSPIE